MLAVLIYVVAAWGVIVPLVIAPIVVVLTLASGARLMPAGHGMARMTASTKLTIWLALAAAFGLAVIVSTMIWVILLS